MEENIAKPTIGTLLERMSGMEDRLGTRLEGLGTRLEGLGGKVEGLVDRLDRIESLANITRGEMLELRIDFRELRRQLKDQFPVLR
jgi:hypothetical protein